MRNWRGKMLMTLVVYFAGFATAIYTLAPASDEVNSPRTTAGRELTEQPQSKGDKVMARLGEDIQKYAHLAQEKAVIVKTLIESKLEKDSN
ncbi:hypothetical protein STSP2_01767 [Anaerohalosphaera lusitana]|uniref:Uncharacterized protein n=1 Tax=Anaerohalosphaera lusitana TaxID=1936003 RepID=A0A1U9NL15_9BACT|nr:hypothetical protein [Anaerohalosphaera lusitana]AQT68599.1 hypothetical protein STSP2_01767 [Anaerohalosphaera lusitana]